LCRVVAAGESTHVLITFGNLITQLIIKIFITVHQ